MPKPTTTWTDADNPVADAWRQLLDGLEIAAMGDDIDDYTDNIEDYTGEPEATDWSETP